jgi:hypothetical protein
MTYIIIQFLIEINIFLVEVSMCCLQEGWQEHQQRLAHIATLQEQLCRKRTALQDLMRSGGGVWGTPGPHEVWCGAWVFDMVHHKTHYGCCMAINT